MALEIFFINGTKIEHFEELCSCWRYCLLLKKWGRQIPNPQPPHNWRHWFVNLQVGLLFSIITNCRCNHKEYTDKVPSCEDGRFYVTFAPKRLVMNIIGISKCLKAMVDKNTTVDKSIQYHKSFQILLISECQTWRSEARGGRDVGITITALKKLFDETCDAHSNRGTDGLLQGPSWWPHWLLGQYNSMINYLL